MLRRFVPQVASPDQRANSFCARSKISSSAKLLLPGPGLAILRSRKAAAPRSGAKPILTLAISPKVATWPAEQFLGCVTEI